jgi:hypothetical protein
MHGGLMAFRKEYPAQLKKLIFDRFLELKSTSATNHLMTMFRCTGFVAGDANLLSSANSLLDTYERHHAPAVGRKR